MAGVIEHVRPPRCLASGREVEPMTVSVSPGGGYLAKCPECDKTLWLNKHSADGVSLDYTFPEHIGRT
jgi:hypothetical protein